MKELIKKIRTFCNLSQSEMAKIIGVQFATINRWENNHSYPTRLAQEKLYSFCEEHNVPTFDFIIELIKKEVSSLNVDDNRIILYHGSKSGIEGEIAPISRNRCDFGKGFYMGTTPEQALTLVCDYEESRLYIVSIDLNDLDTIEVPPTIDWAMLVSYYREKMEKVKGSKLYSKYSSFIKGKDLVIGRIADDRMFFVIDSFFSGNITDEGLINCLSTLQLGKQYVAITTKACKKIKIEKEINLSYFEKKVIKKINQINRENGINKANEICKKYRREGKYFDEILLEEGDK